VRESEGRWFTVSRYAAQRIVDLTDIQIGRELLAKKRGKESAKTDPDDTQKEKGSRR